MTWNSACSIASDDEGSRHSFLSDCDSEFDLRPPPRYPAEKRTYTGLNTQLINRIEPPLTRSRAKATGKPLLTSDVLPKPRRHSALRRSIDAFTGFTNSLTNSLGSSSTNNNNNSILFPKQEASINEKPPNAPLDGVNFLADRFDSCSLDEGKLNKNCVWPSLETNSHYTRPIIPSTTSNSFGTNPFTPSSTPSLFGQQAQLWSRFRSTASTLRNDSSWFESTTMESNLQQVPTNFHPNLFNPTPILFSPQTVPMRLTPLQNQNSSSNTDENSLTSNVRQRKTPLPSTDAYPPSNEPIIQQQSSPSKIFFTLTIFVIGVLLGCLITNTLPLSLIWQTCVKYFYMLYAYLQTIIAFRST